MLACLARSDGRGDGQFFPNLFLLFRAVVGSIARRVLVVQSSRSLCSVLRLFSTLGDTLPVSPPLGSKITPVTFRRRTNSYLVYSLGSMRPLCCGMRSRPYRIVVPFARSSLNAVARLHLNILPAGCLSSLFYPNFYLDLWWGRLRLFRGNAAYKLANCSDSGRVSASMNTVPRGGWWPSAPASTPVPPSPLLLERSGTGTLTLCK